MSNKLIAIRRTAAFFVIVSISAALIGYALQILDPNTLLIIGLTVVLALCVYFVYNTFLSQLEFEEKIKKISEKSIVPKKETIL
jgi:ABC-type uncharacterized transport system permease subunit